MQPSSDGAVAVEATKRGGDSEEQARLIVEAKSDGQGVQVRVCCGRCDGSGESCRGRVEVDIVVRAPAQSRLTVHGVSTDVFASGLTGDHEISTVSGDVEVSGSRELRLKTVSGDVNVNGAAGLKLNTVSGDLKASNVRGETQFHSVSGDVEWKGACGAGCRIEGETTSGDARLVVAPSSSFELEFESRSGDYRDEVGTTISSREKHPTRVRARAGKGEGRVEFQSVSGDLSLSH